MNLPKCGRIPALEFDGPDPRVSGVKQIPPIPTAQIAEWAADMFRLGLAFNMDDPACDIEHIVTGEKLFSPDEARHMAKLIAEIPQIVFDHIQSTWVDMVHASNMVEVGVTERVAYKLKVPRHIAEANDEGESMEAYICEHNATENCYDHECFDRHWETLK